MTRIKLGILLDASRRGIVSIGGLEPDDVRPVGDALEALSDEGLVTYGLIEGGQEAEVDLTAEGKQLLEELLGRICDE